MSVYTQLSQEQFINFCQAVGVDFDRAVPITQGIKNSNWFIYTKNKTPKNNPTNIANAQHNPPNNKPDYVLTLFEERKPHEIIKMAQILSALNDKLPVATPLKTASGEFIQLYDGKAVTVVPVLAGEHPKEITPAMCHTMGQTLATLHNRLQNLSPAHHYSVELYPWHLVKEREIKYMPSDERALMNAIWEAYHRLPLKELPQGLCHLDMFADNTLWDLSQQDTPKLTGLLDFTEVSVECFLMDIAITVNDFCTQFGNAQNGESVVFDNHKKEQFLAGYESVRALTQDEKHALPIALAMAAVTFWLLRLNVIYYNRQQGRTGDNIMIKNPDLMKRLASYHWGRA